MTLIKVNEAKWLLTETIKGCPRIRNPKVVIAHSEFIGEIIQDTVKEIRENGVDFRVNDEEMMTAALLHDIGYGFAEDPYLHPHVGGEFLRHRGYARTASIIETHTYAPEAVAYIGFKGKHDPAPWMPNTWEQILINYASLHAGAPGERIAPDEKFKRFKNKRDSLFKRMIDCAEPRLRKEIDTVNNLKNGKPLTLLEYNYR